MPSFRHSASCFALCAFFRFGVFNDCGDFSLMTGVSIRKMSASKRAKYSDSKLHTSSSPILMSRNARHFGPSPLPTPWNDVIVLVSSNFMAEINHSQTTYHSVPFQHLLGSGYHSLCQSTSGPSHAPDSLIRIGHTIHALWTCCHCACCACRTQPKSEVGRRAALKIPTSPRVAHIARGLWCTLE